MAAVVAGASLGDVARLEGVSPQAVAQSLGTPAAKRAIAVIRVGAVRLPMMTLNQDGAEVNLVTELLSTLGAIAVGATKTVVAGALVTEVPDYELRAKIALKLLEMVQPDEPGGGVVTAPDVVARERVTTTHTREMRTRP